ncbi:MAG: AraC family transcriptional regulator [Ruminococcaceae bacterium]|nr:AraC family transcriptional regulator [Oscillospiraceae bacterium]
MKIQSICPTLQNIVYFKYEAKEQRSPKITSYKSQYVYHVLLVDKGELDVFVRGNTERIKAGDALYLLPGEIYRLLPCGEDFSLYNLFFDFQDVRITTEKTYSACVLLQNFNVDLCIPKICFEDAVVLNESGILKHLSCEKILRPLLYKDRTDSTYCFYGRAALFALVADIVSTVQTNKRENKTARQILEYIKTNPEKDLSGDSLSSIFSYHKNHINKLIKRETGKSLCEYVRYVKVEYAKTLLAESDCSLTEISMRLGYYDYSHFYKAFYKETELTPAEYIKFS